MSYKLNLGFKLGYSIKASKMCFMTVRRLLEGIIMYLSKILHYSVFSVQYFLIEQHGHIELKTRHEYSVY